jgi:putative addiction module CopG family antidote
MQITLDRKLEALVRKKVRTGGYGDARAVVGKALRLLHAAEKADRARVKRLRQALEKGEASIAAGRIVVAANDDELSALFAKL